MERQKKETERQMREMEEKMSRMKTAQGEQRQNAREEWKTVSFCWSDIYVKHFCCHQLAKSLLITDWAKTYYCKHIFTYLLQSVTKLSIIKMIIRTCDPLCERPRGYLWANGVQAAQSIFKLMPIHASDIYLSNPLIFLNPLNSIPFRENSIAQITFLTDNPLLRRKYLSCKRP